MSSFGLAEVQLLYTKLRAEAWRDTLLPLTPMMTDKGLAVPLSPSGNRRGRAIKDGWS